MNWEMIMLILAVPVFLVAAMVIEMLIVGVYVALCMRKPMATRRRARDRRVYLKNPQLPASWDNCLVPRNRDTSKEDTCNH